MKDDTDRGRGRERRRRAGALVQPERRRRHVRDAMPRRHRRRHRDARRRPARPLRAAAAASASADAAVAAYRSYVETQTERAGDADPRVHRRRARRRPGARPGRRSRGRASRTRAIEPVAEAFGDLDPEIDARANDVPADAWTGFHRLEKALWVDHSLAGMAPVADEAPRRRREAPHTGPDGRARARRRSRTAPPSCSARSRSRRSRARRIATRTPICGTSGRTSTARRRRSSRSGRSLAERDPALAALIDAALRRRVPRARALPRAATASCSTPT